MYYRHLLVLAFLVNFAFYQQYVKIMFVNLCESKSEMPMYHVYSSYWCNPAYFAIFPEVTIARCSRKYLFLKHGREIRRAKFLEILEAAIFFQGLSCVNGYFFQVLQTYSEICIFCSVIQYVVSKKQPMGSVHEVLVESLENVFDKSHFIVNLHSFHKSLALPRKIFSPSESFVPHHRRHNNFQNPLL